MFLNVILLNIGSLISAMVESLQKGVMTVFCQDFKSAKLLTSLGGFSFALTAAIVLVLAVLANFAWIPSTLFFTASRHVTPATKALVATLNGPRTDSRRFPLNFLPDSQELRVYDDDEGILLERDQRPFRRLQHKAVAPQDDQEAVLSLTMALQMSVAGKHEKATKLFQHALALNPLNSDVLTSYGEFLEEHEKDVLKANHLYTRALAISPQHSQALVNRERTLPLVEEMDQDQLSRIDKKRDHLVHIPDTDPALKRVKKEAYFQHIYHTVAIEGNTMSLAETRTIVETRMAVPGKSILEHNEILGLEAALKFINSTLVSKLGFIHVEDLLQIHKRVLGHVDPLEAGTLRQSQVFVGEHTPPPPEDIVPMMEDFVDWLNSDSVYGMHPVKYAALAHYKLVHIHPFVDGNGRTSRLLMNLILMRAGYPPVIIRKQDRAIYYEFLQLANEGDVRPFIRFVAECTERTLDVYLYATEYGMANMRALSNNRDGDTNVKIIEMG